MVEHDILKRKIKIAGQVETLTGLHIGSGKSVDIVSSDSPVMRDFYGRPFIPGSSFKGVLRSTIESLVRGLPGGNRQNNKLWSCDITDRKCNINNICHLCSLFGSTFFASRVKVADMPITSQWQEEMFSVRDGVAIDRDSETATDKAKFDFEVVPPGITFKLELIIDNPFDWELGLLFAGFDLFNGGFVQLGGIKSRGLGKIEIFCETITVETPRTLLGLETAVTKTGEEIEPQIAAYKEKLQGYLRKGRDKENVQRTP